MGCKMEQGVISKDGNVIDNERRNKQEMWLTKDS